VLLYEGLTEQIIGAAIDVHKALGTGFLESVYEKALCLELDARGLAWQCQVPFDITYRGQVIGQYIADLVVAGKVIVEVKAVSQTVDAHQKQLLNYLAASRLRVGLVLNFGEPRIKPIRMIR